MIYSLYLYFLEPVSILLRSGLRVSFEDIFLFLRGGYEEDKLSDEGKREKRPEENTKMT